MIKRLKTLIDQHSYSCYNQVSILTDIKKDILLEFIKKDYKAPMLKLTDDFDPYCLILTKYKLENGLLFKFVNEQIEKSKKVILIVNRDFEFSNLVNKTTANVIDTIILRDSKEYMIVISKN